MRISTKGRGIIRAQQGAVARPNPKENYKLPEDQRYQAQTRGMKDFAIEWYKERAKQPKYQSQVNESNLANITDQINRAEYVEPSKFYSNPNVYKGKVGNVTQAAQVAMRQNKGAAYPAGLQYTYNAPSFPFQLLYYGVSNSILTCISVTIAKDADVSPYMKSDEFEVTIGNLREYQE